MSLISEQTEGAGDAVSAHKTDKQEKRQNNINTFMIISNFLECHKRLRRYGRRKSPRTKPTLVQVVVICLKKHPVNDNSTIELSS